MLHQLDIELELTEELIKEKQQMAEKLDKIDHDVKKMNQEFYCDICDKQYKNVAEVVFDVHSTFYASFEFIATYSPDGKPFVLLWSSP